METRRYCLAVCVLLVLAARPLAAQPAPADVDPETCASLLTATHPTPDDSAATVVRLMRCGDLLESRSDYRRAQRAFAAAVDVAEAVDDTAHLGEALQGMGDESLRLGDLGTAETSFQRSLEVSRRMQDRGHEADVLGALGRLRWVQGRYDDARTWHRQALALYKEVDDELGVAVADNNLATTYTRLSDYVTGLDYLQRSLDALTALGDRRRSSTVLDNMGDAYRRLGDYDRALDFAGRAMAIREDLRDWAGIAKSLDSRAAIQQEQGNYTAALASLQRSLVMRKQLGLAHDIAEALLNIGGVYMAEGAYAQAERYFREAATGATKLDNHALEADVLTHLGTLEYLQGHGAAALATLGQALARTRSEEYAEAADAARFALGRVLLGLGRVDDASAALLESLADRERLGTQPDVADALIALAEADRRRGDAAGALARARRAARLAVDMERPEAEWRALTEAGRALVRMRQPADAAQAFDAAIASVEGLRGRMSGTAGALSAFFVDRQAPYQERIELALDGGDIDTALSVAERSKARALLDALQTDRFVVGGALTGEERRRQQALAVALRSANAQLVSAVQSGTADVERVAGLRRARDAARLAAEDFRARLYAAHPGLRDTAPDKAALHAAGVRALLHDDESALLEFVLGPVRAWVFVASAADVQVFELPAGAQVLAHDVEQFRDRLASRDLRAEESARQVYDEVLGPARQALAGRTALIVVPDGVLWGLPFQALQSAPHHYLIADAAVSYAPSATVLGAIMRHDGGDRGPATLLAFGNPLVDAGTQARAAAAGEALGPLPDAETQVRRLAAQYGPSSRVYVGADAREDVWKAEAGHYRILQVAAHGVLDDRSPRYSYLALAASADRHEDGLLEAWEIMGLHLDADLVVLSACETARGRVAAGEGVMGLMWAFFMAGSPATLASQWKVESGSSTALMLAFHRAWNGGRAGVSRARALQRASLELLRSRQYAHPFFWAGYILAGDGR